MSPIPSVGAVVRCADHELFEVVSSDALGVLELRHVNTRRVRISHADYVTVDCPPAGVNEVDQPGSSEASGQRVGTLDVVDALSTVAGVVGGVVLAAELLLS